MVTISLSATTANLLSQTKLYIFLNCHEFPGGTSQFEEFPGPGK